MYYLRPTKKKIKIKTQKNNNNKKLKYKTHNIIQIVCGTEGHITVYGPKQILDQLTYKDHGVNKNIKYNIIYSIN